MSRPHDGHRTFFSFGNPFRMILPKGDYLTSQHLVLLTSFEQTLAKNLKQLKPKEISDVLSLSWMSLAMEFLSDTHNNIKTLITDLEFPVSDWEEKWVDIYLDTSVKLLDICTALSSELSRMNQGQLLLQYVLHVLELNSLPSSEQLNRARASLHDWVQQNSSRSTKLENCSVSLHGLAGSLHVSKVKNSAKGKVLMRALYGVKVVTIYICSVLVAALSGCIKPLMELNVPDKFIWAATFSELQDNVNKEITAQFLLGKVTVLKELEAVETCVERVHALAGCDGKNEVEISQKNNAINQEEGQPTASSVEYGREELPKDASSLAVTAEKHSHIPTLLSRQVEETSLKRNGINQEEAHGLSSSFDHGGEEWLKDISDMAGTSEKLSNGLNLLSKQVEDFFQIVLTGRDALLCNLREPDVLEKQNTQQNNL